VTPGSQQPADPEAADDTPDRPAILVSLAREVDERLYEWIAVGAEEEGIPCRLPKRPPIQTSPPSPTRPP